jgi:hypothetical protein
MANITVQLQQLQINTIVELKKQSDALKIAKELAENKAIRIEEEFRSFVDKFTPRPWRTCSAASPSRRCAAAGTNSPWTTCVSAGLSPLAR